MLSAKPLLWKSHLFDITARSPWFSASLSFFPSSLSSSLGSPALSLFSAHKYCRTQLIKSPFITVNLYKSIYRRFSRSPNYNPATNTIAIVVVVADVAGIVVIAAVVFVAAVVVDYLCFVSAMLHLLCYLPQHSNKKCCYCFGIFVCYCCYYYSCCCCCYLYCCCFVVVAAAAAIAVAVADTHENSEMQQHETKTQVRKIRE